ncbi:MAG: hypothetical protein SGARI_006101 [Bacillariaceae sp.]
MIDMILLAGSDVVIAGQYSSFTQTIPLAYQFEKAKKRKTLPQNNNTEQAANSTMPSSGLFCNVGAHATVMECFDDYSEWMMGKSSLPLVGDPGGQKQNFKNLVMMPVHKMMLRDVLERKLKALPVDIVSLV